MKKLVSWLSFMTVFCFMLHSCVQDEIYSSTGPTSKEYHSKSFWKEDEKYIKNVMKIYFEHESEIKKIGGSPAWDYSMSMGKYNETFMAVPIVENGRVINTLVCARFDKKVYFRYENSERNNKFFNDIIFGKYTNYKIDSQSNKEKDSTNKGVMCGTRSVSMWYPDNESNPNGSGHWETNYYTNCYSYQDYYDPSWEQGGGGFDYNGGGGSGTDPNNPDTNQNPCEKTKSLTNNPGIQNAIQNLKNHISSNTGGELGWKFNKVGPPTPTTQNSAHSVVIGDPSSINGAYHNHTGTTLDIFSATDINTLLEIARYQDIGNTDNAFYGLIAPDDIHYLIYFNGTHADLPASGSYSDIDIDVWKIYQLRDMWNILNKDTSGIYCNNTTNTLNSKGLEKVFFDTLNKMGISSNKIVLQKIDSNNNISTVIKNNDGMTIEIPCS